jgi:hypothetical protein
MASVGGVEFWISCLYSRPRIGLGRSWGLAGCTELKAGMDGSLGLRYGIRREIGIYGNDQKLRF